MQEVKRLIENFSGEIYNLCYTLLESAENECRVFEYTCITYKKRPDEGTIVLPEHFTKEQIEELESVFGDVVDGLLNSNIKKCNLGLIPESDFYCALWNAVCANFSQIEEKAFAFYYILIDKRIPYQFLGKPITMSNARFREVTEKNRDILNKITYISTSGYTQRTERASLLLNCLEQIDDYESKVVVLAHAISRLNSSNSIGRMDMDIESLIKKIDQRIAELEQEEKRTE